VRFNFTSISTLLSVSVLSHENPDNLSQLNYVEGRTETREVVLT